MAKDKIIFDAAFIEVANKKFGYGEILFSKIGDNYFRVVSAINPTIVFIDNLNFKNIELYYSVQLQGFEQPYNYGIYKNTSLEINPNATLYTNDVIVSIDLFVSHCNFLSTLSKNDILNVVSAQLKSCVYNQYEVNVPRDPVFALNSTNLVNYCWTKERDTVNNSISLYFYGKVTITSTYINAQSNTPIAIDGIVYPVGTEIVYLREAVSGDMNAGLIELNVRKTNLSSLLATDYVALQIQTCNPYVNGYPYL